MIKPRKLQSGDTVALVSLSSGLAGEDEIRWRTEQGIERLENVFGLKVKVMPHALKGIDYIYNHPEKRAADLNSALKDKSVKAIICAIGGNETVRILPFIDTEALKNNPKIFTGYSDSTTNHLFFYKYGISTSYGPALLTDFAENIAMDDYTVEAVKKTWFSTEPIGEIQTSPFIREAGLRWDFENKNIERPKYNNPGYESINGTGKARGHLIGGCLEVLNNLRGTEYFPGLNDFKDALLFLETSECTLDPEIFEDYLRAMAVMGVFEHTNGIVIGRPFNGLYYAEYKEVLRTVLSEAGRIDLPVLYNASFGHNEPKFIVPYGLQAEIDTEKLTFKILESAVVN
ncbi:LD-carboxypeptidase [Jeotgalicoccus coquinae]|uniref:Microcin C7 self-immunity protein MccF n=1 Tax=Jeotgalicoccus coquinae TaxID=709509 RepID=A0A6V7R2C7_9STAP|nr:S66 peptidase family protein [Jeotgalicoccus coquinae]MBB6423538.1 muramoyltetrapeptide carboxypeptidase LdcA involved in peptidoglycan recycling [Jeotgalicoccus coquinae]GGE20634.1 LD-carboxypeptidase [Jeotgalicoccus coquinae]CAD2071499.1 Microcin C7 self-immunity protein MccF [Jeotgalicoccus coquinae]